MAPVSRGVLLVEQRRFLRCPRPRVDAGVAIGDDPDQEADKRQRGADGTGGGPAQPFANGNAAQERAERIGGVERRMVEGGSERLRVSRRRPSAASAGRLRARTLAPIAKTSAASSQGLPAASGNTNSAPAENSRMLPAVGISARSAKRGTNRLPSVAPIPNTARKKRNDRGADLGDLDQRCRKIGIDGEHAAEADCADRPA